MWNLTLFALYNNNNILNDNLISLDNVKAFYVFRPQNNSIGIPDSYWLVSYRMQQTIVYYKLI